MHIRLVCVSFFVVCTEIQIGYSRRFVVLAKYKYRGRRVVQYRYKIVCWGKNVFFNDLKEMFSFKHFIYVCRKKARNEEKCTKKRPQTRFFYFLFCGIPDSYHRYYKICGQ